jgi:hypothetical protein
MGTENERVFWHEGARPPEVALSAAPAAIWRDRLNKLAWGSLLAVFCLWLLAAAAVPVLLCLKLVGVL